MSSRKFRGILTVAMLTVAVGWMAAGPAAARTAFDATDACTGPSADVTSPASTVRVCDASTDLVVLDGSWSGKPVQSAADHLTTDLSDRRTDHLTTDLSDRRTDRLTTDLSDRRTDRLAADLSDRRTDRLAVDLSDRLSMAAVRLADRLGVAGLATGHSVMNIADQGGMAATAGAATLPGGIPGTAGLADVSRLAEAPDLPTLRRLPRTDKLPVDMPAAGSRIVGTVTESPVDPLQPVNALPPVDQVKRETVAPVLPEVPEHAPAIDDANGLIQRLPVSFSAVNDRACSSSPSLASAARSASGSVTHCPVRHTA
ncbi:hypothetical protein [Nonomuraea sp. NEAU-A123]|uniref:hypothetical protein n=1 Tax=Nonomuraea sp. NEAU-A123 TaxID=2839649 RepID=UPI001BE41238|nr:hypothetical protein [Nonomuraea sp. NEAU-A123]MBT2231870.1 hypothetical protein [Nonomuraea sp. NEAU-A123]